MAKKAEKKTNLKLDRQLLNWGPFWTRVKSYYGKNPKTSLFYTAGAILLLILFLIFTFYPNLFLAGKINGRYITTLAFYNKMVDESGNEVFETITRETLIKQESRKNGIQVSREEINQRLSEIEESVGGREELEKAITENQTTLDKVEKQIELQLLIERLLEDKISVSDEEIQTYRSENQTAETLSDEDIRESLKSQKLNQEFSTWFQNLKDQAEITRYFE